VPWDFSVLVLTLNEEADLPLCLASVAGCDDVVLLDSGSTDRTLAIASAAGARTFHRPFDGFAGQRNYAQREIPFRHPWVFHLDADEQMTPELAAECGSAALRSEVDGFLVAPLMIFHGRWIRHCTDYPAWQARFVRAPNFEFIEAGHGQREAPHMRLDRIRAGYLHDLSSGGDMHWLEKHRRYARAEALAHFHRTLRGPAGKGRERLMALFSPDPLLRRRALKSMSYALPFRPAFRFIYQFVLRRGFLDGWPGLRYCLLLAQYEGFASSELRRLRRSPPGTPGQ
jgi:glycosyltransferase involved in cell wall biosynthesis